MLRSVEAAEQMEFSTQRRMPYGERFCFSGLPSVEGERWVTSIIGRSSVLKAWLDSDDVPGRPMLVVRSSTEDGEWYRNVAVSIDQLEELTDNISGVIYETLQEESEV